MWQTNTGKLGIKKRNQIINYFSQARREQQKMQRLQNGFARQEEPRGTLFLKAQHPRLQEVPIDRV